MNENDKPTAWIALPEPNHRAGARTPKEHPYNFDYVPAMGLLISAHPRIAPSFGALYAQVMFAPGALSRAEREMIAAVAAAAQDCHY
jgi:hypothetical protein